MQRIESRRLHFAKKRVARISEAVPNRQLEMTNASDPEMQPRVCLVHSFVSCQERELSSEKSLPIKQNCDEKEIEEWSYVRLCHATSVIGATTQNRPANNPQPRSRRRTRNKLGLRIVSGRSA